MIGIYYARDPDDPDRVRQYWIGEDKGRTGRRGTAG